MQERSYFRRISRFYILPIRGPKKNSRVSGNALDETFGEREFQIGARISGLGNVGMREGVVSDEMTLIVNTFKKVRIFLCLISDHKEGCWHIVSLEYVQDGRGIGRIRTVIEGENDLLFPPSAVTGNLVGERRCSNFLIGEQPVLKCEVTRSVPRAPRHLVEFSDPRVFYAVPGSELIKLARFLIVLERLARKKLPERGVFGSEPPEGYVVGAQFGGHRYLVVCGHGIEEPDFVLDILFVGVREVRIETLCVKIELTLRLPHEGVSILKGECSGGLGSFRPVVSVVPDGDGDLFLRDGPEDFSDSIPVPREARYRSGTRG